MNTSHPLDESILDLRDVRKSLLRAFLADHEIDTGERDTLAQFDREHNDLIAYRRRQVAAANLERNGLSRQTRQRFQDAGFEVIDLAAERRSRRSTSNVVKFPTKQNEQPA